MFQLEFEREQTKHMLCCTAQLGFYQIAECICELHDVSAALQHARDSDIL
jgi:hypothetical protein